MRKIDPEDLSDNILGQRFLTLFGSWLIIAQSGIDKSVLAMPYKNKSDINFSISDSESKLREDAIASIARESVIFNESNHSDPAAGTRQLISSRQNSNSENTSSTNPIESQEDNKDIVYDAKHLVSICF